MTHLLPGNERTLPTLDDVARVAGVSRATVSRVVNGGRLVSADTAEAVNRAIGELGYQPNRAARALVTRRAGAVAVVVPETDERVFSDPFFPQAYHGALTAFSGVDVQVLLAMAQPGESAARMGRYLDSGHVDGAIVLSHHGPELAHELAKSAHPAVFIGDPQMPGLPYVELDQVNAAITGTNHLIQRGATRIATITGPMDMNAGMERLRGFESAMTAAGLVPVGVVEGDFTARGGELAATRLLAEAPELDGLFVASDLMAFGAMRVLRRAGRRIPDEVRVVGFDNSTVALQTSPQLTTMTNPASELARMAGEMLLGLLSGAALESPVILTSELIIRNSA
ncbi:MAG: LacI family DNA-binding transcriptional regulator [Propionicimonas sp.]|nr:LacI family DNA-binding transcriptional regulator [Propionicimonas sp.]